MPLCYACLQPLANSRLQSLGNSTAPGSSIARQDSIVCLLLINGAGMKFGGTDPMSRPRLL